MPWSILNSQDGFFRLSVVVIVVVVKALALQIDTTLRFGGHLNLALTHCHLVRFLAVLFVVVGKLFVLVLLLEDGFFRYHSLQFLLSRLLCLQVVLLGCALGTHTGVDLGEEEAQNTFSVLPVEVIQIHFVWQRHV